MKKTVTQHRQEVEERLSSLETNIDNIYHHVKDIKHLLEIQNGRVRKNEEQIAKWKGVAGVIVFLLTMALTLLK